MSERKREREKTNRDALLCYSSLCSYNIKYCDGMRIYRTKRIWIFSQSNSISTRDYHKMTVPHCSLTRSLWIPCDVQNRFTCRTIIVCSELDMIDQVESSTARASDFHRASDFRWRWEGRDKIRVCIGCGIRIWGRNSSNGNMTGDSRILLIITVWT